MSPDVCSGLEASPESIDSSQAKIAAIRNGTSSQPPEVDAIGFVLQEVFKSIANEPFPWSVVDALRALDRKDHNP